MFRRRTWCVVIVWQRIEDRTQRDGDKERCLESMSSETVQLSGSNPQAVHRYVLDSMRMTLITLYCGSERI